MWGGIHAGFVFWGLKYPFNYRMFKISGKIRYAHIISVLLAVVLPLPGALVHLKGGYVITASPSLVCAGRNTDYTYFAFTLPLSVLLVITTCLIALILWTVLKVSYRAEGCIKGSTVLKVSSGLWSRVRGLFKWLVQSPIVFQPLCDCHCMGTWTFSCSEHLLFYHRNLC